MGENAMKSSKPLYLAAALAALLLAGASPVRADDGIHRLWEGFSTIGNPVFQMAESFWRYVTGTGAPDGSRTAVAKEGGTELDPEGMDGDDPIPPPPPPGGGCVDPLGCPNPKP
jgi:hypothetical protein